MPCMPGAMRTWLNSMKASRKTLNQNNLLKGLPLFATFDSDRIKEWNGKTKEILALKGMKRRYLPLAQTEETNRPRRRPSNFCQQSTFFKKLDAERGKT